MLQKLLCLILFFSVEYHGLQAQGYLVLKTGDTIRFEEEVDVPSEDQANWNMIGIGQKIYLTEQIDGMLLKQHFYKVIHNHFYKRVIQGRITVYVLKDEDTIPNNKGFVHHRLFIQGQDDIRPKRISNYHLHQMMKDPINIDVRKRSRYSVAAIPFMIYSSPGIVSSVLILGVAALSTYSKQWMKVSDWLDEAGLITLAVNGIYFAPGAIFYLSGRRVSLKTIHKYNAMRPSS